MPILVAAGFASWVASMIMQVALRTAMLRVYQRMLPVIARMRLYGLASSRSPRHFSRKVF